MKILKYYSSILIIASLALLMSGIAQGSSPRIEGNRLMLGYGNIVEVGMVMNVAITFLEGNNYSCGLPNESPDQIIYCESINNQDSFLTEVYEINLVIEDGKIVDFHTGQSYLRER